MRRVIVGCILHETNTFNPTLTDLEAFKARGLLFCDEIVVKLRNTNTEIGGFIETLEQAGFSISRGL